MDHNLNRQLSVVATPVTGYCPPKTFAEFYQRYPGAIKARLRGKWHLFGCELEDWEHEVCVSFLTIPPKSVFRRKGCVDRVAIYDPTRLGGNSSEGLFLNYIHLLVDNFCRGKLRSNSHKLICKTVSISEIEVGSDSKDVHEKETAMARLSAVFAISPNPFARIMCREIAERADQLHPLFSAVMNALLTCSTKTQIAAHLNISDKKLRCILRDLKALGHGEQVRARRQRNRRKLLLAA
jgi:hypothetical protein